MNPKGNYYPKNWNANGYGWHNLKGLSYSKADTQSNASSSGVSSMCPYPSVAPSPSTSYAGPNIGFQMSYGFAAGCMPNQVPNPNVPRGSHESSFVDGSSGPSQNIGWALSRGDSVHSEASENEVVSQDEIPCQSIFVPADEMPIYGNYELLGEKGSGSRHGGAVQDFNTLRSECLQSGVLFEDPDFPAIDSSLQFSRRPDRHIEWLRPMEIADNPEFFVEGYSRFDVQQGELGDCWLLAAASTLTQDPKLFFRVVPDDQSFEEDYAGIFHFRFWQYGRWIDVVVDDRLPTYRGELLYMHSTEKNEFWSALLEKAYAKLHGSYEALKGGTTCEAMEDFTGGVTEMYELNDPPPKLFEILMKGYERNSMMACSIEPDPNVLEAETPQGLIKGHAYSITKVELMDIVTPNTSGKIPMIRLRNPWGNEAEWNGPWSDQSPEWRFIPEHVKMEIGLTFDHDGEFWMSFQDWMKYYDRVELCNLSPDSLSEEQISGGKKKWEMSVYEGEWTAGVTAGGCRNYLDTFWHNPQYVVTLEDPDVDDDEGNCTVIIALMQKNRRSQRNMGMDCLTIGFAVYRVTERDLAYKPLRMNFFKYNSSVARSPAFINLREVSCRFKLPPGHYLIVPSTFEPNEEGEFLIRVFSESRNHMEVNDEDVGVGNLDERIIADIPEPAKPTPQITALEKLFKDIAGEDMEVDWMELKRILDHSMRDDFGQVSTNGLHATQASTQESAAGVNDTGGGEGGGGGLLAAFCAAFCKDNPLAERFGVNQASSAEAAPMEPITSQIMPDQPHGFSKDVCRSMIAMMDIDGSGKLGFEEFKQLLTDLATWKAVFKLYDRDHSGRISASDLREALNSAGYKLNNRILNALAHRYSGRDGMIQFDDFIMCTVKIKTMMDIFKQRDVNGTNAASFSMEDWLEKTMYS